MVNGNAILAITIILATFIATLILTKGWIRVARAFGLTGKDVNKWQGKQVAESGGIAAIFATVFGLFVYVFFKTFLLKTETHFIEILAIVTVVLLAGFIGFIDDILGWKKGLRQWQKPLLTIPIALPLAVLNAGHSMMDVPILGTIDFGLLYPLLIVPLAVICAANGFNMLAGLNGLESGMGAIILGTLSIILYESQQPWLALIAAIAVSALIGFFLFNKYPAKVFPGNSLTYAIGALIGALAVVGDVAKAGVVLFMPYIIELILKTKTKFKIESFGIPTKDGQLLAPKKISSLTHISMRIFKTEKRSVLGLLAFELILAIIVLIFF